MGGGGIEEMRIKLVDGRHKLITETVIPNFHQIPSIIFWKDKDEDRTFVRWDICSDEWVETSHWTVRGSSSELARKAEIEVSRR